MSGLRNATMQDLAEVLKDQQSRKHDVIAPASSLRAEDGGIVVRDFDQQITVDGVTSVSSWLHPTAVFDEGIADKFQIPLSYVRRLRADHTELWDQNVNGWLDRDDRSFLLRAFTGGGTDQADIGRAFLSDSYKVIDHLDALTAVLDGVKQSGANVEIQRCDLTDRKMYVKVAAPGVQMLAPDLLQGYRSPFTGQTGAENPVVFAGFVIQNSETGSGAFSITPQLTVQVCQNGMTMTKDALRAVHLGGKLEEGVIRWSDDTQRKTLELITAKTTDAVATFLDVDYMRVKIQEMNQIAHVTLPGTMGLDRVKQVSKKLLFSEDVTNGILDHFMQAGDFTSGGVMQAVTSFSQTVDNADDAYAIESQGLRALELAAAG